MKSDNREQRETQRKGGETAIEGHGELRHERRVDVGQEPDALEPPLRRLDGHLARERRRHLRVELAVRLRDLQVLRLVEVLAQPAAERLGELVEAHHAVEMVHVAPELGHIGAAVGDDLAEDGEGVAKPALRERFAVTA